MARNVDYLFVCSMAYAAGLKWAKGIEEVKAEKNGPN